MTTRAEERRLESFPLATYRLQLHRGFTFHDARAIVPYLHALGITDCYLSPISKAVPGSDHGYDVIDPTVLNPELGTDEEFTEFISTVKAHGMGVILDVVPNHMGIAKALNRWWCDVLENGPSSRYASAFDIDWRPIKRELTDKVLLPILPDQYGAVLERQDMQIVYEGGSFFLQCWDYRLPLSPKSWTGLLSYRLERLIENEPTTPVLELQSILTAIRNLPNRDECDRERVSERYREKEIIKKRLAALMEEDEGIRTFVMENVRLFNGEKGRSESFDLLDAMLNEQAYRLASWKVASEEINYRRFFDINELAAIRMEDETVFQETHRLLFQLASDGAVRGCRIDHVDGLYDPGRYLTRLRELTRPKQENVATPFFIVVEKILAREEPLPDWPVQGTTGYDFLNQVNGLFVACINEKSFTDLYTKVLDREVSYADLAYGCKQLIMRASMASELNVLGNQLNHISERDRRSRDFTLNNLTHAIREIIACFPVYRTYVTEGPEPVTERDSSYIHTAVAQAKRRNPAISGQVFDFVRSILLKQRDARTTEEDSNNHIRFVMKFQQTTSPVTAKGMEDTAFYRYHRLVSLNEVGGDREHFGMPVEDFHKRMRDRQARWPSALSASSTHDTKRSEDARARINVLSELPREWKMHVRRWNRLNRQHRRETEGELMPDRNDEYAFYQTLIGVWPFEPMNDEAYRNFCERVQRYMQKAVNEAKVHTSWINPNPPYDHAVQGFVEAVLDRTKANRFLEDFLPFQARVAQYGLYNSLSQLLLKMTAPGIPDFFQGTELWSLHLVDPDNRGAVDYQMRMAMIEHLRQTLDQSGWNRAQLAQSLFEQAHDGRIKLYLSMIGLDYRRLHPELFQRGEYLPLECDGTKRQHVCAFARMHEDKALVTIVPRLLALLNPDSPQSPIGAAVWDDTCIAAPSWPGLSEFRDLFTGEIMTTESVRGRWVLPLTKVFRHCPLALLERLS